MTEYIIRPPERVDSSLSLWPIIVGEIVRCRDCKHHHEGMCMLTDGMGDFKRWYVDDDDYCSDGEVSADE